MIQSKWPISLRTRVSGIDWVFSHLQRLIYIILWISNIFTISNCKGVVCFIVNCFSLFPHPFSPITRLGSSRGTCLSLTTGLGLLEVAERALLWNSTRLGSHRLRSAIGTHCHPTASHFTKTPATSGREESQEQERPFSTTFHTQTNTGTVQLHQRQLIHLQTRTTILRKTLHSTSRKDSTSVNAVLTDMICGRVSQAKIKRGSGEDQGRWGCLNLGRVVRIEGKTFRNFPSVLTI